jgi:hypothetical protein
VLSDGRALGQARVTLRHLPFHSLRHTAVSLLIAHERLNPQQLMAVVGHASIELTFKTYGHLFDDAFDGFGEGLDALAAPPAPPAPPRPPARARPPRPRRLRAQVWARPL